MDQISASMVMLARALIAVHDRLAHEQAKGGAIFLLQAGRWEGAAIHRHVTVLAAATRCQEPLGTLLTHFCQLFFCSCKVKAPIQRSDHSHTL
jgi:hypothetical protein